MSFAPSNMGYAQNEEFFNNPALAMRLALQQRGMTDRNWLARRLMERANETIPLSLLYGGDPSNFLDFLNQYIAGQTQAGGPFGVGDIRQRAAGFLQGTGNPALDEWMRQGSDEEQFQKFQSFRALAQRGFNPAIIRGQNALDERQFQDWWIRSRQNPTGTPETFIDAFTGRTPAAPPPLPGMTGPTGATTPTPGMTTPQPADFGNLPGATTPRQDQAGGPFSVVGNPYATPGGAGASAPGIGSWQALLDRYRQDQRNWGTEGFRPNPGAFQIGNLRYDPTQDQVSLWNNMSGQGRQTRRGNFMGQFLYTLQQLMDQLARGGNPAIGLTPGMSPQQVAQLAFERLRRNAVGNTGFSMV